MPYVLDESSFRVDKTVFPTAEEAEQRAAEAARIVGRPIAVYELVDQELGFAFRVMPDGTRDETQPTVDVPPGHVEEPSAPAILGRTRDAVMFDEATFDSIAEVMEQAGRLDLAAEVDSFVSKEASTTIT